LNQNVFAILGVGNILEKDDGVAVYATAYLRENYSFKPPIDIINGGVEGINLLNLFMEYEYILILDAINIEDEAGSIYHIPSHELAGYGLNSGGAHEVGVLQCIDILELMGKPLPKSSVLGIIPKTIDLHIGLSTLMHERFSSYIQTITSVLKKEGFTIKKKDVEVSLETIIGELANPTHAELP